MRRVNITGGNLTLMDYCTAGPQYASGGFIADSQTGFIINGSQQQFLVRNSSIGGWSNGVWNQVFSGVDRRPGAVVRPDALRSPPYTTLDDQPGDPREAVPLRRCDRHLQRLRARARQDSRGATWAAGPAAGDVHPDRRSSSSPSRATASEVINNALAHGQNLIFTPGVYHLDRTINVKRPDTVVLGLGLPTLDPGQRACRHDGRRRARA